MRQRTVLHWSAFATHFTLVIAIAIILFSSSKNRGSDWDRSILAATLVLATGAISVLLIIVRRSRMGARIQCGAGAWVAGLSCLIVSVTKISAPLAWSVAGLMLLVFGTVGVLSGLRWYHAQVKSQS